MGVGMVALATLLQEENLLGVPRNVKLEPIYSHQGFDAPPPTEASGDPPGAIGAPPMEGEAPRGVFPVPMAARALCVAPSSTSSRFSERQLQTAPSQLYQNEIQQKESAFSSSVLQKIIDIRA